LVSEKLDTSDEGRECSLSGYANSSRLRVRWSLHTHKYSHAPHLSVCSTHSRHQDEIFIYTKAGEIEILFFFSDSSLLFSLRSLACVWMHDVKNKKRGIFSHFSGGNLSVERTAFFLPNKLQTEKTKTEKGPFFRRERRFVLFLSRC